MPHTSKFQVAKGNNAVVVRLKGGLGNQLFQYATARALAIDTDRELLIDTGWFARKNSNRAYGLNAFSVNTNTVSLSKPQMVLTKTLNRFGVLKTRSVLHRLSDPANLGYRTFPTPLPDRVLLDGYWQSYRYFEAHRATLLKELRPASNVEIGFNPAVLKNAVAVHVRRGDYITGDNPHIISEAYLRNAMNAFGKNATFVLCSDDVEWCKRTFEAKNIVFSTNSSELQDLVLMSQCAHNIIANSTFSWWAAWLNEREGQRVIAPVPWTKYGISHLDILPSHWETMPI